MLAFVLVDNTKSDKVPVISRIPLDIVLGPLLLLMFNNNLLRIRLFADDCIVYKEIQSTQDNHMLEKDLNILSK